MYNNFIKSITKEEFISKAFNNEKPTPYFKYVIANLGINFFKAKIEELDIDHKYIRLTPTFDVSSDRINEYKENHYKNEIEEANKEKEKWKEDHLSFYRDQPCLPNTSIINPWLENIFEENIKVNNIEEAIQAYKEFNELKKSIPNSDLDEYCTETMKMINNEHRQEMNDAYEEIRIKLGIPSNDEIKSILKPENYNKKRLCLDRSKCINPIMYDKLSNIDLYNPNK